jgi:hypothetical protein
MTEYEKIQELARISESLSKAVRSAEPQEWRQIVRKTIRRIDDVIERLPTPVGNAISSPAAPHLFNSAA